MVQDNQWSPMCRYQGYTDNFDPNTSNLVSINLYRQVIGFKIIVDDFTKGEMVLSERYGHQYTLKSNSNDPTATLQIEVEPPIIPIPRMDLDNETTTIVQLFYNDGTGNNIPSEKGYSKILCIHYGFPSQMQSQMEVLQQISLTILKK